VAAERADPEEAETGYVVDTEEEETEDVEEVEDDG